MKIEYKDYNGKKVKIEEGVFSRKVIKPSRQKKGREYTPYFHFRGIRIYSEIGDPKRSRIIEEFWEDIDYSENQFSYIENKLREYKQHSLPIEEVNSDLSRFMKEFNFLSIPKIQKIRVFNIK